MALIELVAARALKFFNNAGEVVLTSDSFSKGSERILDNLFGSGRSHVRVGHYSVVVPEDRSDLLAALVYKGSYEEYAVNPGSEFFAAHKRDRVRQLSMVEEALTPGHPLASKLKQDISAERAFLNKG